MGGGRREEEAVRININTAQFQEAHALVKQWQRRVLSVRRQFLFRAVDKVYRDILSILPSDRKELRRSMQMRRIRGLPESADGYVIRSVPKGAPIPKAEAEKTVIYVAAKTNLMRPVPIETQLLADYGPWTTDTLPYLPDPKTAAVISRRVSPREVVQVRRLRNQEKPKWRRDMLNAGIRLAPVGTQSQTADSGAVPDTAFESMRLEFGLGGEPLKPHWRKAIRKLASRSGAGMIARNREFARAMMDPSYRAWERWPRRGAGFVTAAEAKRYRPFQKRLGIRVG